MIAETPDVIVVGTGAAGLTAATVAAVRGLKVLVLEASDMVGGTTAVSGGMVWIPANHKMPAAGISDSLEAAREYLAALLPADARASICEAFLARGDEMVRFLEAHSEVRLQCVPGYPDYYPAISGSAPGARVLEPVPYDGNKLGSRFADIRWPLAEFMLFGGMMVSRADIPHFRRLARSPRSFIRVLSLVVRYLMQRLSARRGTTLYLGNALVARLYKSALDRAVEFRMRTRVESLLVDRGRVCGVTAVCDGKRLVLRARQAVILASGGISHDAILREPYLQRPADHLSATIREEGAPSGARLAVDVGAAMARGGSGGAFWVPASKFLRGDGSVGLFPHTVTDRSKPGLIAVNSRGKRFVNEARSYHEFGKAQLKSGPTAIPAFLVCDRKFLWKYGLGRVRPFTVRVSPYVKSGYLHEAASLESLESKLGLPIGSLVDTVRQYNKSASEGLDPQFSRGGDRYQQYLGDGDVRPNPCVAPLVLAPFYSVAVYPADLGMSSGILADEGARVLKPDGSVIEGLYACGNDMDSPMSGAYPGPGITIGPAMAFGYIAAQDIAAAAKPSG